MARGRKRTIISLGVGLSLLAVLVYKSGPGDFGQIIRTLKPGFWLVAFFLYLIAQLIKTEKLSDDDIRELQRVAEARASGESRSEKTGKTS